MCGICGIYEYGRSGYPNLEPIGRMTDALAHRGPDSDGTWTSGRLALGHRRLSIFDLSSAGAQPMASADGRAMVVFNGEIYNFHEIRAGLESAGHRFRSGSDTEVLLAQYRHRGIEGLHDFRGMFAFALWDLDREELYVVRDRLGVKPLYYVDREGMLVFASEIKSLLRHPEVSAVLDPERLTEWLALRYSSAPATLFRDVRKLEPGCYLRVDRSGVHHVRYWDVDLRTRRPIGREEAVERYGELFRESVRLRMRADVPVGVFLSGGLDSSMVALEAAAATSRPIQTFTVGYRDNEHLSELTRARLVADHLGSEHHELILDEVDPTLLGEVVWHLEEPVGDPATVLLHRLSEFTRRNVTVVLSGEGSDETNLGYTRTSAFRRWSSLRERALVGSMLGRVWLKRNAPTALDRGWDQVDEARVYAELTWGGAARRATLAGDSGNLWLRGLHETLRHLPGNDRLSRLLYLDLKGWMADDLLLKVDKTTMAYALEARVPFLDHKLVEFNLGLPPEWKINGSGTKLLAREVVRGRLPESTVARSQHGFIAPLASWFSQGWKGMLDRSLGPDGLGARRLFAPALLDTVRTDIAAGRSDSMMLGFMLMSLEHWFDRFDVQVEPLEAVRT